MDGPDDVDGDAARAPRHAPPARRRRAGQEHRRQRGARAFRGGAAAEDSVARHYEGSGRVVTDRRWRGTGGEIDLVTRDRDEVVFVEVKQARTLPEAARRLTAGQIARIVTAASEYLGGTPRGQLTACRFDLALVDRTGQVEVVENAFGA
jgi:putative endonuclease